MSKKDAGGRQEKAKLAVVIMAAGKGTRLKSRKPKVLHEVGGTTLLSHVIAAASEVVDGEGYLHRRGPRSGAGTEGSGGVRHPVYGTDRAARYGPCGQVPRWDPLPHYENVLVLSGDVPLIRAETIEQLWRFHQRENAAMTILTAAPENPAGYGRVVRRASRRQQRLRTSWKHEALAPQQRSIREINSGIYAFKTVGSRGASRRPESKQSHGANFT